MALRPFITAGVAFAAAGAVAATVAIAPPMSPGEVKVAQKTQVDLNANLTDLINTYFGEFPGDPDNAGTIHAFGVLQQLLQNANVNDPRGTEVIDSYFEAGLSDVVRLLLTRDYPNQNDPTPFQINTFFNEGLSEVARYRLLAYQADPTLRAQINTFFGDSLNADGSENIAQNGFQGLFYDALVGTGLSVDQRRLLDTFFNAPTIYNSQAVPVFQPILDEDGEPVLDEDGNPTYVQAVDAEGDPIFDENGDPVYVISGYLGNPNPARRGSFGVIYNTIRNTGLSPDQQATLDQFWDGGATEVVKQRLLASTGDPTQKLDIETFFDGGISENFRWRLVAGAGDQRSKDLWNEFFDNGVTGVVRYLLTGPVPEVESPPVPVEVPETEALKVAATDSDVETLQAADVSGAEESTADSSAPAPTALRAAPVQAAAEPAPATAPVESTSSVKQEAVAEEEEDTEVKDGNKVEPVIIVPGGGGSSDGVRGGGAWGVFKPAFKAIDSMIKGGKTPAGSTSGGTTDGGATDGADNDGGGDGE
ncbi:hypothetical protein [Mycolicibacterium lacusdiani]|uniref:hypothetical protein n=1 Tax=Mycolicibacterium lacusdiani TaxID=2895283 RepID=UPI001F323DA2|nr:hypothetical protein [Mycolicibacterium lacusdiani]